MDKVSTVDLYKQLQERLILDLHEGEIECPNCKGLRFVFIQKDDKGYIESCSHCYTGRLTVCSHCGKGNTSWCDCKESQKQRDNEFRITQSKKEMIAYNKAQKINYREYDGKYWIEGYRNHVIEIDDVEEWIYEMLTDGKEVPDYLWAQKGTSHFSIDLYDVINDNCEDGYEDMFSHLDTNSPLLEQAQELISEWEKEQATNIVVYDNDYSRVVIIGELVDKIRNEIKKENPKTQ